MSRLCDLIPVARRLVRDRLSPESAAHCERVAVTARALAERFDVDTERAELAGLLHDLARDMDDDALLAATEEFRLPVLSIESEHPYLLHARVGAAQVRRELPGTGEAVLSAIAAHTVGAVPMSDLDRVVYLADMIEPARDYPGVEELRWSCTSSTLADCFAAGYARSLVHVMETGRPVHPVSAAVTFAIERETGRPLFDVRAVD